MALAHLAQGDGRSNRPLSDWYHPQHNSFLHHSLMNPVKTKWVHILFLNSTSKGANHTAHVFVPSKYQHPGSILQGVPLPIKPSISLIILKPMKILQRDLNRSTFVVWEMWHHNVLEVATICVQTELNPAPHILEIPCQYVRCHCLNFFRDVCFQGFYGSWFVLVNSPFQISP